MQGLRYLEEAVTLQFDAEKCTGCRVCTMVCPHGVFAIGDDRRAYIVDRGACMECGACALNCAWDAISVEPGVGCAEAIIHSWIHGGEPTCGCATPGPASGASAGSACCGGGPVLPRELPGNESCGDAPSAGGCGCGSAAGTADAGKPQAPA